MSNCLGLFYAKRLGNCILCLCLHFVVSQEVYFVRSLIEYEIFLNISIWCTVTSITSLDQNGVGIISNKGELHIPQSPKNGVSPSDTV